MPVKLNHDKKRDIIIIIMKLFRPTKLDWRFGVDYAFSFDNARVICEVVINLLGCLEFKIR